MNKHEIATATVSDPPGGEEYRNLPPDDPDAPHAWMGHPADNRFYEKFVRDLLAWAYSPGGAAGLPMPELATTAARWAGREICVRTSEALVTRAVIDFTGHAEGTNVHLGGYGPVEAGWIAPELTRIGSVSRETAGYATSRETPCLVTLRKRELALVSLDHPVCASHEGQETFWDHVIDPLCHLGREDDFLLGWWATFCEYSAGRPVLYVARYLPGEHLCAIAAEHDVRIVPAPLGIIPEPILERAGAFRFLWLTEQQWDALDQRHRADGAGASEEASR